MKGNQKAQFNQRIDIDIIGGIARSAQKRGETTSHMTEVALSHYLAQDIELTAYERQQYKKKVIENALNSLASGLNMQVFGDILTKTHTIMAVCSGFDTLFPLRDSTKNAKLSLFEILKDIEDYDNGLFQEIMPYLNRFKKLKVMYAQITL